MSKTLRARMAQAQTNYQWVKETRQRREAAIQVAARERQETASKLLHDQGLRVLPMDTLDQVLDEHERTTGAMP